MGQGLALKIVDTFLDTPFSEEARHRRRIEMIDHQKKKEYKRMSKTVIMDHPLIQHKIGIIREKETSSKEFRELVNEIAMLMGYEAFRELPLKDQEIETPICRTTVKRLEGKKMAVVPILRAGLGMVQGLLNIIRRPRWAISAFTGIRRP